MSESRLARLPTWISFWLGYRETPVPPQPAYIVWLWSFVGAFSGLAILQALVGHVPYFVNIGVPSMGATAVLIYGAIESPLAQPRPVVFGHLFSAAIGVSITKLFSLMPEERFLELCWLPGALACALALVVMQMTGTTHPPAGATALIAAINPDIRRIGWFYVPVVLMAASIAILVALFTNNMQRQYPTYWWTPAPEDTLITTPMLPVHKMNLPKMVFSEPPTPTDSTVVSRRTSLDEDSFGEKDRKALEESLRMHAQNATVDAQEGHPTATGNVGACQGSDNAV